MFAKSPSATNTILAHSALPSYSLIFLIPRTFDEFQCLFIRVLSMYGDRNCFQPGSIITSEQPVAFFEFECLTEHIF